MASDTKQWAIETTAVHAGTPHDEHGPVSIPISLSSAYRVTEPGTYGPFAYARSANPTRSALEEALTALEGGAGAAAFASGLAAIDAVLRLLRPGDRIVVSNDIYGGTWRLLDTIWREQGVLIDAVDMTDTDAASAAFSGAALALIETPSNPMLRIVDLAALVAAAHTAGCLVAVDNTFATPYLQRPLDYGADFAVHSTTKYLGGHSDVIGGAVIAKTAEHAERIRYIAKAAGAVAGPFDAYLVLRGIRTLAVRMDRQCESAATIAKTLTRHSAVAQVYYPGLPTDPGFDLCAAQMRRPGGMVSFRHAGGADAARQLVKSTRLFTLAISLGAVESLIEIPAVMTHVENTGTALEVPNDLIRLSIGLENVDDLLIDLEDAFKQ